MARNYIQSYNRWMRGEVSTGCCVVTKHVNRQNSGRTTRFWGQCSFPFTSCPCWGVSVLWLFVVTFNVSNPPSKAINCSGNAAVQYCCRMKVARWVTPALHGKMRLRLTVLRYPADRATRIGGLTLPHLSCKRHQGKMRDYMTSRVTLP